MSSIYDRIRNPESAAAARAGAGASGFGALRDRKYALLVTYRRSGEAVPTPVWFGLEGAERLYVRTGADAAKVKRLRADARVLVGPSDARGKPLGPLAPGTGRVVEPAERPHAEAVLRSSYGLGRLLYERIIGDRSPSTYLEVTPA
ncbi:MAG TPA: PPOX class F420-dependent oxidoreductase [Solirubrobacteraceae bacterium]|jgi:PPOX class probable F420-dependent enzyme|nr:PPOX class F420-dependent oxidoreductase [Solirubrobacteraceae bacterium]